MRPRTSLLSFLAIAASIALGVLSSSAADAPVKKRVLNLGDSISIRYTPFVQKMPAEEMVVLALRG